MDGIPALIIDPKGDLGNLLLTFPNLAPDDFLPWIHPDEAQRAGLDLQAFAKRQATRWREGLASWGQGAERIRSLRNAADFAIFTPGSSAGLPLSILKSFAPPTSNADPEILREAITATVSSLLALLKINADPLQSREHILLSTLLDRAWKEGRTLDLPALIQLLQNPPIQKIGVLDLETFYPAKDRFGLILALNNLLASPGFSAWTEGQPLDLASLLHTPTGKPRHAIISIAHLNDAERMFVVASLLNEAVRWMRAQPGTSSLRAILYMDEILGYFPPVANPPSKAPLLTLLKQARACGLGVVLATQNPIDLDYKGLGNTGTWFIGRLQTDRDRQRLLDGLQSTTAGAPGSLDFAEIQTAIASLSNRRFLLHNVHADQPTLFETRWCMSYLAGPLTREQIRRLTPTQPVPSSDQGADPISEPSPAPANISTQTTSVPPTLPPDLQALYPASVPSGTILRPFLLAAHQITYTQVRPKIHHVENAIYAIPLDPEAIVVDWQRAIALDNDRLDRFTSAPPPQAHFAPAPPINAKSLLAWLREWTTWLANEHPLVLFSSPSTGLVSEPGEDEGAFRIRLAQHLREIRDQELDALRTKYERRFQTLEARLQRARQRVETRQAQATQARVNAALSIGTSILGALLGSRRGLSVTSVNRATTAARSVNRTLKGSQDIAHAKESAEAVLAEHAALQAEFEAEAARIHQGSQAQSEPLQPLEIRAPRTRIHLRIFTPAWL